MVYPLSPATLDTCG